MKKLAIASIIALAATAASALEMGVKVTRDYSGEPDRNGAGVNLTQRYGAVGLTAGFDRFTKGSNDQDRYSLVAGYDLTKVGVVTVTPKVGVAYLNNQVGQDGYAMTAGVGLSMPVTKKVSLGVDLASVRGQDRGKSSGGNTVAVGLNYEF